LAQVQSAAKAKYEAEAAATAAKEKQSQVDGPHLLATVAHWQIIRDAVGRIYYNDTRTNTVTWERPSELDENVVKYAIAANALPRSPSVTGDDDDETVTAVETISVTEPAKPKADATKTESNGASDV